ncbi:MAG: alpha-2-macroglobulin [Chloroflexi bacterium]|nr:alpha-2-macroglobulin [Chloroflexota bacterium]
MLHRMRSIGLAIILGLFAVSSMLLAAACRPEGPTPTVGPTPGRTPVVTLTATATPVPTLAPGQEPDSFVAVAPKILRAGVTEPISISLMRRGRPAAANAEVVLLKDGQQLARASALVSGTGTVSLPVPSLEQGSYQLELRGQGFSGQATVQVQSGTVLFVETDKPIYKPGQVVHIRVLTLDPSLKPLPGSATVEVMDAKGIKVFKREAQSDEFGMASVDLPLSTEPNLGVWKITAVAGERRSEVDIRVEEYVLPKYEVAVELGKDWVLASESVRGTVSAGYPYGKPVRGTAVITARRYVGTWQEFAKVTKDIDGSVSFELPAAGYVAGVPGAAGQGNVQIDVEVEERNTAYKEKTYRLLTVAATPVNVQVIPESGAFKPGLPFTFLVVTETLDNKPLDKDVSLVINYMNEKLDQPAQKSHRVSTKGGQALLKVTPPDDAVALTLEATADQAHASLALNAGHSPSGNFIHVEQVTQGTLKVGDQVKFHVSSTAEARNFYYEVLSRGGVLFSGFSTSADITLATSPQMAPNSRLLVYQVLPTSEVAADYIPFSVEGDYPHEVKVAFSKSEARPGDELAVDVHTQGQARVGLVAVDRSVYILAENRLNLQQVFDELERLYQKPQVELHEARPLFNVTTLGAKETFDQAGVVVMTNKQVPEGKEYQSSNRWMLAEMAGGVVRTVVVEKAQAVTPAPMATLTAGRAGADGLAEVQRVRQFFPETWLWSKLTTDGAGRASLPVTAPDSITTWMLRAVGLSKEHGLGVAEAQLKVFQPFFLQADLPYSAVRGEELPVRISLYNYLDTAQQIQVELEKNVGFDLLSPAVQSVQVAAGDLGGASFTIRPTKLGSLALKVTARSPQAADAVIKELLVEPEGVSRETVDNAVLSAGGRRTFDTSLPSDVVAGSGSAYVALTGSYLTQSIQGLEGLLKMPFGCGEQNMLLFAPNVFVARYLKETGQLKPEVMAKAENLMVTGYQREMTYRRSDGSFSAFGNQDKDGSLWLTAFVLKTFAQAGDLVYIDPAVLDSATSWIVKHQKSDGSFEPVGFLHHQELLGGLKGNTALTGFVAVAMLEAGETTASARAVKFLEGRIESIDDPYAMAIAAYALEMADSPRAGAAYDRLMGMGIDDENGLHWGAQVVPLPEPLPMPGVRDLVRPQPHTQSSAIENTGYGLLAVLEHGDRVNASRAARWLVSNRNAFGGFGSTQDTVVGLQALTQFASAATSDVDLTVTLTAKGLTSTDWMRQLRITPDNADVLQTVDVPVGAEVQIQAEGRGQVVLQSVRRFNLPAVPSPEREAFEITVDYGTEHVAVDDLITISAKVRFNPSEPIEAGMVVLDIAVPTGFAPEVESLKAAASAESRVKRHDVAGRKVIFYIEDMKPGESISIRFQARAQYPVRAQAVTSQVYSYYNPGLQGESLGGAISVAER